METLRKPFFVAAVVLIVLIVLVETGAGLALRGQAVSSAEMQSASSSVPGVGNQMASMDPQTLSAAAAQGKPPGVGIPCMALLDGLILFTTALMGAQFLLGERLQGRIQGVVTLIVSLLALLGAMVLIFLTLAQLLLMVGLFVSVPFGTLIYMIIWGFFNTGAAKVALGLLLLLKFGFVFCLVLAQQRFLQNKGLVLIVLTSFVANLVVSFLHALVPSILVSITDSIAAIVVLILAAIWAFIFLIGSLISIVKAIT
jgi:hypothetical protein